MDMIDFHSHILPCMDDGSRNPSMSCTMLQMSKSHGITTQLLTPHFYGDCEDPKTFLHRREESWKNLQEALADTTDIPDIRLGAEVAYYPGLSHMDHLEDFCIQGTKLILIELPFTPCTTRCYQEIEGIRRQGLYPVMAHVERYFSFQPQQEMIVRLKDSGALIQCNGEFFLNGFRSRKAFAMMKKGQIDVLGSDCHNLSSRPPNLGDAVVQLQRKMKQAELEDFFQWGQTLFAKTCVL